MKELERAIVDTLIKDNPINVEKSNLDGTPEMACDLSEIWRIISYVKGREVRKQFDFYANRIAWNHGCIYDNYGPRFFIIVRQPRDLQLGVVVDTEKVFNCLRSAQHDLYEVFAGLIARLIVDFLMDLSRDDILAPAMRAMWGEILEFDYLARNK
jgi:hypothetical protein